MKEIVKKHAQIKTRVSKDETLRGKSGQVIAILSTFNGCPLMGNPFFTTFAEVLMKRLVLLGSGIILTLLFGCASTKMVRTEEQRIPSATGAGSLDIVLTAMKDMEKEKVSFLKAKLTEKFEQAGFTRVAVVQARGNAPQEIDIKLTNYEFTQTKETDKVAASAACTSLCVCMAPVLGAPRYFDDQYEISADVTAYGNGRLLFKASVTEKAHSTANVIEAGSATFKAELEELTIHNFVATVVNRWNKP